MTKPQAVADFQETFRPVMADLRRDRVALREEWSNYTDSLCKSGLITIRQYETWTSPF